MVVEALDGPKRSLIEWARLVSSRGGYITHQNADGTSSEIGWSHRSLAEAAQETGLLSSWKPSTPQGILEELLKNRLVIASVSYEAGDETLSITKKGGHLMVVLGADFDKTGPIAFYVNNPSGRRKNLQVEARLPIERFASAFSERIIIFEKPGIINEVCVYLKPRNLAMMGAGITDGNRLLRLKLILEGSELCKTIFWSILPAISEFRTKN